MATPFKPKKRSDDDDKEILTKFDFNLAHELADLTERLIINKSKAQSLLSIINSKQGNTRKAVYQFDVGRGYTRFGFTRSKPFIQKHVAVGSCYYKQRNLARIEVAIRPYHEIGTIPESILTALAKIGNINKVGSLKYREVWLLAMKEARRSKKWRITPKMIRRIITTTLLCSN